MMSTYDVGRPSIPAHIRREVEVEAGHKCSIKDCKEHTYLELHHINVNREDNRRENLILLCDKHHKMAHNNIIDRKSLYAYKEILRIPSNNNIFNRAQEGDRVYAFRKTIMNILSYTDDCNGLMFVGTETGYYFEQEVYVKLRNFFQDVYIYNIELRSYDSNIRDTQDQIVSLLYQMFDIRENGNYLYNGSYCAKFIPASHFTSKEYNDEINNQIKLVNDILLKVQALLSELLNYVETRI